LPCNIIILFVKNNKKPKEGLSMKIRKWYQEKNKKHNINFSLGIIGSGFIFVSTSLFIIAIICDAWQNSESTIITTAKAILNIFTG